MANEFRSDNGFIAGFANLQAAMGAYRLVYFVDPIFGKDTNDGRSWMEPFATPQAAIHQFMADKADLVNQVGAINTTPIDYTGASQIYGQDGLILLGAGDYGPADNASPVIEIPSWSAEGATTGGGWGLTIMGVPGNARALIEGGAANTVNMVQIAGARGVRILNVDFHRGLQTATTADIFLTDGDEVVNETAAAAGHHSNYIEIAGCRFLGDLAADGECSPAAIHMKSSHYVKIHDNWFGQRYSATAGRHIILENDDGNPGRIDIRDNVFEAAVTGGIQYLASASIQGLVIRDNLFIKTCEKIGGGALAMANAVDLANGKAASYQPVITDNRFYGWAALDATAGTDALYDAQGTATVNAGTDYLGNDATNLISS